MLVKMNHINYKIVAGAWMLLSAFAVVSCVDGNDWDVDNSYNRLFSVTSGGISVDAAATTAEITWGAVPEAEYYIIEISTDSLYNEVEMGATNALVYGEDKTIVESPYTLTGLTADTKYFLRIKSMSSQKVESKWSYFEDYSFETATEQIFESLTNADITDDEVILHWEAGAEVTHIEVADVNETVLQTIELTAENKAEGIVTVTGLTALTQYTVTLYNGEVKRGVLAFTTAAKVPDADYSAYLSATDSLSTSLLAGLAEQGYQNVNIVLPAGAAFYNEETVKIPDGLSVTFFGLPGETKAVIAVNLFDIAGTHGLIAFENVTLTGYGKAADGSDKQASYAINQSNETTVGTLSFSNTNINGFANTPLRFQKSNTKIISNVIFSNCMIEGNASSSYALVNAKEGGVFDNVSFTNCTVINAGKSFMLSDKTDFTSLTVTDCTLYNVVGASGGYFLDCNKEGNGPSQGVTITNTIFGSTATGAKGIRANDKVNVVNSYATADVDFSGGNRFDGLIDYEGAAADLFADPENGDFTIIDNTFDGKKDAGDPRWR